MQRKSHEWTKLEVKKILSLWEEISVHDLAKQLGVEQFQLCYIIKEMRKAGFALTKKRVVGRTRAMLLELKRELTK